MVAFRKVFPLLAIVALLLGSSITANAQTVGTTPFVCTANAGVPPLVRAEGLTELVGDILLVCTGGGANPQPFLANFTVFLNTNVTSRLLGSDLNEALLLIDDPGVARTDVPGGGATPATPLCFSPNEAANQRVRVPPLENDVATTGCNPTGGGGASTFQRGTYTTFRGRQFQQNAITWAGVPVIPPGTTGTRTFRFTNIRANASIIGAAASGILIPNQITAFISVSGSQSVAIDNPQQTVAYVQRGLTFDTRSCSLGGGNNSSLAQCVSTNTDVRSDPNRSGNTAATFGVRFSEGFQTAFKTRIRADQSPSTPGTVYNTESGFVNFGVFGSAGTAAGNIGFADQATRLYARFTNLPPEAQVFVTVTRAAGTGNVQARLVQTGPNGEGGAFTGVFAGQLPESNFAQPTTNIALCVDGDPSLTGTLPTGQNVLPVGSDRNAAQIPNVGGGALAVWEIVSEDPSVLENISFLVTITYAANTATQSPAVGQSRVSGGFAPFYAGANVQDNAGGRASSSLPIPRFLASAEDLNAFRIDACETTLLFPFVTAREGFDTGIAISNTSDDIFGTPANRRQAGRCEISYFGDVTGGGNAPNRQTTPEIGAGRVFTFTLTGGGGAAFPATPGFQGYIFARCLFRYAHGFAFITDGPIGAARVAEGYLALVVGPGGLNRGTISESLGN